MAKLNVDAPAAPAAAAKAPPANNFSPEEQAVVNALNEIATACTGAKKFEGPSVAAVDAFKTSLENFTLEQLVAVDASTIILESLLNQPKNFVAREAGVTVVQSIVEKFGEQVVSLIFETIPVILQLVGDKKSGAVRELAEKVSVAIFKAIPATTVPVYVNKFLIEGDDAALASLARWQTKVCALKILSSAAEKAPREIEGMMITLVPIISDMMWDTRKQVQTQSADTLEDICDSIDNIDLEPFIPSMVEAIQKPDTVPDCVYALAGTTFVQTVTASALSITVPILERGFKERKTAIKRKCAVITENMAKLVKNPADVAPFMPIVMPLLEHGLKTISDPECRGRFEKANEVLVRVSTKGTAATPPQLEVADVTAALEKEITASTPVAKKLSL